MMAMLGDGSAPGSEGVMMMRRYATYIYAPQLQLGHMLTTGFAYVAGVGQLAFFINMLWSLRAGDEVTDPWDELFSGQHMPSPEWDGLPYRPPTAIAVSEATDGGVEQADGIAPDGGMETAGADGSLDVDAEEPGGGR
jgi:cytochrome c oxidase subunit 1